MNREQVNYFARQRKVKQMIDDVDFECIFKLLDDRPAKRVSGYKRPEKRRRKLLQSFTRMIKC